MPQGRGYKAMKKKAHSTIVKKLWHSFFSYEMDFLDWLNANTKAITSLETNDLLKYRETYDTSGHIIESYNKPPSAFRHVCYLKNSTDEAELLERIINLKEKYLAPVLKDAEEKELEQSQINTLMNRFPHRFPEFYPSIKQINISVKDAFSSNRIDRENCEKEFTIKTYNLNRDEECNEQFDKDKKALAAFGLHTATIANERKNTGVLRLKVQGAELLDVAKVNSLQLRAHTGSQYRARLFDHSGSTKVTRYGLIILNDFCHTHTVLPQPQRKHSLEKTGNKFDLPITSDFTIWINSEGICK